MTTDQSKPKGSDLAIVESQAGERVSIAVRDVNQLYQIARMSEASGMAPKGMDSSAIGVAILMGGEVGLPPMQAVQNISVITGRPTLWGDGARAVVRRSGLLESIEERTGAEAAKLGGRCVVKRKGEAEPVVREFTRDEAKAAGLLDKQGPWRQYPGRMFQMRARAYALRDVFADVLRGVAIREEVVDYREPTESTGGKAKGKGKAKKQEEEEPAPAPAPADNLPPKNGDAIDRAIWRCHEMDDLGLQDTVDATLAELGVKATDGINSGTPSHVASAFLAMTQKHVEGK